MMDAWQREHSFRNASTAARDSHPEPNSTKLRDRNTATSSAGASSIRTGASKPLGSSPPKLVAHGCTRVDGRTKITPRLQMYSPASSYSTFASSFHGRPCDSATPAYVMYPLYVFTPSLS